MKILAADGNNVIPVGQTCTRCGETKSLDEFYRNKRATSGRSSRCKTCADAATKASRQNDDFRQRRREQDRKRYQDPTRRQQILSRNFKSLHGISLEQFAERVQAQEGKCAICGREPEGAANQGTLFQDHCHLTGILRSALCGPCNSGLGMFGDSIERLLAAVAYLQSWAEKAREANIA